MSTKDSQDVPSPEVDGESNNVSCIPPHPVIPNTGYSLEDSEIVEGHPSGIHADARPPMSPQKPDRPELLHASGQVSASIPTSSPIELVGALTYTDEPMTKEGLDRAKSLVLDLLGWGVTPEYLVECGLSPGTIYTIFTDLRLRLPRNLDTSSVPRVTLNRPADA